ncbi:MAG: hypothetical protein ACRED8_02145 [Caulobacteraceae bacterium]
MIAARASLGLVASPFLGQSSWAGVAEELRAMGRGALALEAGICAPDWRGEAGAQAAAALAGIADPLVVALHSAAGGFAEALFAALAGRAASVIFVDAILPHPGRSWLQTAPEGLARRIGERARDGLAPPWNEWFAKGVIEQAVPEETTRAAFLAGLPRVPLALLEAPAPQATSIPSRACAYLRLSDGYVAEAREAERRGWRVDFADLGHLAMIADPRIVAERLAELAEALAKG